MMTRQEKIISCINPATQLGLEIGALNKPIVTREMGNIRYVDHASTEELKQKYANDSNVEIDAIVQVDYVWGTQSLPELVGDDAPFDYVIASHVIEHVPDFIGWLKEVHAVLKPGGILALAIPDKRYCFDFHRPLTQSTATIEAYLQGRRKPSPGQIFEFFSSVAFWNGQFVWAESAAGKEDEIIRSHSIAEAWKITNQIVATNDYYDVHCWVFTPSSFFELLKILIQANLFDFKVAKFYDTVGCEFYVSLEAIDLSKEESARQAIQLESISILNVNIDVDTPDDASNQEQLLQFQADLEQERAALAATKTKLQTARASRKNMKAKISALQAKLVDANAEISAMESSKFWKLREQWMKIKKVLS